MYFAIVSVEASPAEHTKYPADQKTRRFQKCFRNSVLYTNQACAVVTCFNIGINIFISKEKIT